MLNPFSDCSNFIVICIVVILIYTGCFMRAESNLYVVTTIVLHIASAAYMSQLY